MSKHFDEPYLNGNCYYSLCKCNNPGEAIRISIKYSNDVQKISNKTVNIFAKNGIVELSAHKRHLKELKTTINMLNSFFS